MSSPSPPPSFVPCSSLPAPNLTRAVPSLSLSPTDTTNSVRTRTLRLAGGRLLTFSESDVPDPPAISFAIRGVESLASEWDDSSPNWAGRSSLVINGVPVAVKYWPSVYKYWKTSQWDGTKKNWFDWKAPSASSMEAFWGKYSVPGRDGMPQRMKYTPLLNQLSQERKAEDNHIAAIAKQELSIEQLTYRKGGRQCVMKKASKIAARYRELKGLAGHNDEGDEDEEDN
ncbi:hypothetical protein R3P38DRAFT_2641348 [Favolaschia claudopus]|uniref:Uncharacterized protein n=1 Tax=Favolaschia claudopus TaxID=2862362 RepID=A0AAW0AI92_9AGAR